MARIVKATASLAALALAACGTLPIAESYLHNTPVMVSASIEPFQIHELNTFESKDRPGKLWLQPTKGHQLGLAVNGESTRWAAMASSLEPAYRQAALDALAKSRVGCEVRAGIPYPEFFAFEFEFVCDHPILSN